jgi:hypothetical protein
MIVLRPEAIALSLDQPDPSVNQIRATVQERHFLGHTTDFRLACADGTALQVHQNSLDAAPGMEVWCSFPPERCWLIPAGQASTS